MLYGVQIIGILFGLIMIYLSYIYYKRKSYSFKSYLLWTIVWLLFIITLIIPDTILHGVIQILDIQRTADFFVMSGFLFFAVIIFYLYITVKKNERKVENIIRAIAFEHKKKHGSSKTLRKKTRKKS